MRRSVKAMDEQNIYILGVEDNAIARRMLKILLETAGGIHSVIVETGEELVALHKATPRGFDCILMDVGLPGISGLEATQEIRAYECAQGLSPILICAITGLCTIEKRQACFHAGMDDFMHKPATAAKLFQLFEKFDLLKRAYKD